MKKSTIWLLAVVMFVAFFSLLFLQVRYMKASMSVREQQFNEMVKRSLINVSRDLEQEQTRRYLEEDMLESENRYSQYKQSGSSTNIVTEQTRATITNPDGSETRIEQIIQNQSSIDEIGRGGVFLSPRHGVNTISKTSFDLQQSFSKRYLYEQALMNEVILKLLYRASSDPIEERINFYDLDKYIRSELLNSALNVPYSFQVIDFNNRIVYSSPGFSARDEKSTYTQILFPNDPPSRLNSLKVYFPTKRDFVSS